MENLQLHVAAAEELYNLTVLEEMDDKEYLLQMLTILLREAPKDIKEMMGSLQAGNIDMVCKKAHKLKGSAGIIQAERLTVILENIEVMSKNDAAFNQLRCFVDKAVQEYNCIEKALKIQFPELK